VSRAALPRLSDFIMFSDQRRGIKIHNTPLPERDIFPLLYVSWVAYPRLHPRFSLPLGYHQTKLTPPQQSSGEHTRSRNSCEMDAEEALQQQLPAALRQLQPAALQAIQHSHAHHHTLAGPLQSDLQGLDSGDPNSLRQRLQAEIENPGASHQHAVQSSTAFEHSQHHLPHMQGAQVNGQPLTPQHQQAVGGQFGMLTPGSQLVSQSHPQHSSIGRLQQDQDSFNTPESAAGGKGEGHLEGLKLVPNPPNLQEWREKLFNVNEIITLTEEECVPYGMSFLSFAS
jgi:hypothetical protein